MGIMQSNIWPWGFWCMDLRAYALMGPTLLAENWLGSARCVAVYRSELLARRRFDDLLHSLVVPSVRRGKGKSAGGAHLRRTLDVITQRQA
jgi:hypothetical protein